jgi:glucan phosphorylase
LKIKRLNSNIRKSSKAASKNKQNKGRRRGREEKRCRKESIIFVKFLSGNSIKNARLSFSQICYILYPGDESLEGKILRLKQQYTLCSASLQDIIARFERRSGNSVNWEDFPAKVAVQMNDTHPTLCIPELMRILIDVKGLSWDDAWKITQRCGLFFLTLLLGCFMG